MRAREYYRKKGLISDVTATEELKPVVKGPLKVTDIIAFCS